MRVALIVPTKERPRECARAVHSAALELPPAADLIVVDQGQAGSTGTAVAAEMARCGGFVRASSSRGASAARNEGAALTSAEVVVFLDDDCVAHPGWLGAMSTAFESDPSIGVAFGTVRSHRRCDCSFEAGIAPAAWGTDLFDIATLPGSPRPNPIGLSANMAVRRAAWAGLGGFDECLGAGVALAGGEEWDLAYRAARAGWKVAHVPGAVVDHIGPHRRNASQLVMGYARGTGAMLAKHLRCGDRLAARLLVSGAAELAVQSIHRLLTGKRPLGLRSLFATLGGVAAGLTIALDRRLRMYRPSGRPALGLISAAEPGPGPRPDYVRLRQLHGLELCLGGGRRSLVRTMSLVARGLFRARRVTTIFADGEHVGLPLALALSLLRVRTPVVMIGHHLTRRYKLAMLAWLCRRQAPIKLAVHSRRQAELLATRLPAVQEHVSVVSYGVDTEFWNPAQVHVEEDLVVAAGREHRDYRTLARACAPLPLHVFVALGSAHTRRPRCALPDSWPANFSIATLAASALRERYARSALVVVPLLPTDFQAGITSLLEAMAMGKAVIVTATTGLADILDDEAVCRVPTQDSAALREAILRLWARPRERARRGRRARRLVEERHSLDGFVAQLATAIRGTKC